MILLCDIFQTENERPKYHLRYCRLSLHKLSVIKAVIYTAIYLVRINRFSLIPWFRLGFFLTFFVIPQAILRKVCVDLVLYSFFHFPLDR